MGGVGSDIAVDAADIALVDDEVKELPHLIALSHRMMTTIKLNMTFSMTLNFLAITLAIIGILVLAAGLYYLKAEKNDPESKKIYTVVSAVGAVIAVVCALLLFL